MGTVSAILWLTGFGVGVSTGLVVGYYLFIFFPTTHLKDPDIPSLVDKDTKSLQRLLRETPIWVKYPDFDRVDWLNKFLIYMWPYLDKALCKTAKKIADPIIAQQIPKYKVEFEALTLGSLPLTFQGIKVYVTDEKELMMEPALKWAGNSKVTVAVKAYGLKATVQVEDLQVFASPRITFKPLVPSFPCFAKIYVSLMEKPYVDFGLKLLRADLMSIPGLYRFVQVGKHDKMGMNVVSLKELTPDESKELTLDLLKNMNPNDPINEKSYGQLVVELTYKPFKGEDMPKDFGKSDEVEKAPEGTPSGGGVLVVIVHEAQDVEGKHHTNPFVRIHFRGMEKKTKHVKKNRDPRWEEEFFFVLEEPPTNDRLHVEVLSSSSKIGILHPTESLGYIDISLADVTYNKRINEKYYLIDSKNGRIQIELQWRTL